MIISIPVIPKYFNMLVDYVFKVLASNTIEDGGVRY
jgi:hypothetical protein